ncbi:hypothetical protein D9615_008463 [Tricholomella constricta]|uniref:Uncharacterized protein n=1 Tax=Tricholomella constricta TaxID=117010 RepID=A0A8H5H4K9_9AGAR|nr:hypothetical protein D9615_008463 [Tricholomella constricta]
MSIETLTIPQHTNPALSTCIAAFQSSLLAASPPIRGLDPSIIIKPVRFRLTLADKMASPTTRTVSTALALLRSLKPRLDAILNIETGEHAVHIGLRVILDALDIMRPVAGPSENVWANMLYVAPCEMGADDVKLRRIAGISTPPFSTHLNASQPAPTPAASPSALRYPLCTRLGNVTCHRSRPHPLPSRPRPPPRQPSPFLHPTPVPLTRVLDPALNPPECSSPSSSPPSPRPSDLQAYM